MMTLRGNSPKKHLDAGWVLLQFNLMRLIWEGRDAVGNFYEVEQLPLEAYAVEFPGCHCMRCYPENLIRAGAKRIMHGNVANNR